jgi:S1-C subfamily serine protease
MRPALRSLARSLAAFLCGSLIMLLLPSTAEASPKRSTPKFYEQAGERIATVEFVQEFLASGQKQKTRGFTDGVVISADGLVLISGKVRFPQRGGNGRISSGSRPELTSFRLHFADGRSHEAEVIGFEDDLNLGLLRITDVPVGGMPHIRFRTGFSASIGQGLRSLTLYSEEYARQPLLAPLSIGALLETPQEVWSLGGVGAHLLGAPLWDGRGRVVGVVAQVPMSPWAGRQMTPRLSGPVGLSYDRFSKWIEELVAEAAEREVKDAPSVASEQERRAWLGVMFGALDPDLADHLGISPGGGVVVSRVVPASPAERAGLKSLDVLVELAGERIAVKQASDTVFLAQAIRTYLPGATLDFVRELPGGAREPVSVVAAETPTSNLHARRKSEDDFELTVREVTVDTLLGHRLPPDTPGVVVDGLTRAGWAGLAGLRVGGIIQRIGDHDVTDLDSFGAAMKAIRQARPTQVMFFVRSGQKTRFFVAEPDWSDLGEDP